MAAATTTTLAELCAIAALDEQEKQYLGAKGLVSIRHFCRSFTSEEEMVRDLVDPFVAQGGITIETHVHQATRSAALVRTAFLVLYDLVQETTAATKVAAQAPPPTQAAATTPTLPASLSTPTSLSAGDWALGVDRWSNGWTPPRQFNVNELFWAPKRSWQGFATKRSMPRPTLLCCSLRSCRHECSRRTAASTRPGATQLRHPPAA